MACSLSHNACLDYSDNDRVSKSTITRTTQHVRKIAEEYGCKNTDPWCFANLPGRGGIQKITDEHKALITSLTTQDREHREKEA